MTAKKENVERTPRTAETRDASKRPEAYTPPPLLPLPSAPGFVFHWIRRATRNEADTRNMARRLQQGWVPVRREEFPEIANLLDPFKSYQGDYIESGGLILAKMPEERAQQIRDYNTRQSNAQVEAVDNNYFSLKDRGVETFRDPESRVTRSRRT